MINTKWFKGTEDLKDSYAVRTEVFIKEQMVPIEGEFDGSDEKAILLVIYDGDKPVATGRILEIENRITIGRIAVLKEERGKKYGDFVMRLLIRKAFEMGWEKQYLHAQTHAIGFYEKLGFKAYGEEFMEEGISHVSMVHDGDVFGEC